MKPVSAMIEKYGIFRTFGKRWVVALQPLPGSVLDQQQAWDVIWNPLRLQELWY